MIYTERVINVKNGDASIDQTIVLYRGDRNIEIVFEIVNNKFKFSEKGNYILDIGAKYGQLAVDMPDGTDLFTEIAECMDGKVIFKITGDMINEIAENGFYSFHVRLFNEDKTSRVTIPPIMQGIEIREPIVIEGDAIFPIVDMGGVNIAPIDSDKETFIDEDGKLNIKWQTGDIISSTRLNQMISYINDNTYSRDEFDLSAYVDKNYVTDQFEIRDRQFDMFEATLAEVKYTAEFNMADINEIKNEYVTMNYVDQKNENVNQAIDRMEERIEEQIEDLKAESYSTTATLGNINAKMFEFEIEIADHDAEIETVKEDLYELQNKIANGDYGSEYATEEYVNNRISGLQTAIDQNAEDITDVRNVAEEAKSIAERGVGEEQFETLKGQIMADVENDFLQPLDEVIQDHEERIQTLEQSESDVNKAYVDGKVAELRSMLSTHYSYIGTNMQDITVLEGRLGDINSILDAINGEVI